MPSLLRRHSRGRASESPPIWGSSALPYRPRGRRRDAGRRQRQLIDHERRQTRPSGQVHADEATRLPRGYSSPSGHQPERLSQGGSGPATRDRDAISMLANLLPSDASRPALKVTQADGCTAECHDIERAECRWHGTGRTTTPSPWCAPRPTEVPGAAVRFLVLCQANQSPSHGRERQGDLFSLGIAGRLIHK
jgi:hypothetical protein